LPLLSLMSLMFLLYQNFPWIWFLWPTCWSELCYWFWWHLLFYSGSSNPTELFLVLAIALRAPRAFTSLITFDCHPLHCHCLPSHHRHQLLLQLLFMASSLRSLVWLTFVYLGQAGCSGSCTYWSFFWMYWL
jgi:hypothetical protein